MLIRPATPADLPHLLSFDHLAHTPARRSLLQRACASQELHVAAHVIARPSTAALSLLPKV